MSRFNSYLESLFGSEDPAREVANILLKASKRYPEGYSVSAFQIGNIVKKALEIISDERDWGEDFMNEIYGQLR